MKLTCFIFTHAPEAPLLDRCIATARAGKGTHEVAFVVVEDGNAPLPKKSRNDLERDGVTVVRSLQPRNGNLRGLRWFAEQMEIFSDHAGEANLIIKIDPDTLVLSIANIVKPMVDDPALAGSGYGKDNTFLFGSSYVYRRWIIDVIAAKYARLDGFTHDALLAASSFHAGKGDIKPISEDILLSREALVFGPLDFSQNRIRWRHDKDGRDMAAARAAADVVLMGNPAPVSKAGGGAVQPVIAKLMDAFIAAETTADPMPADEKPTVVLGLGPGRSGTSFMATLLNLQPGAWISHESYSPVLLHLPNVDGFAKRLVESRPGRRFIGDFTPLNTWMAAGMTRWLLENGYPVKLISTTRDEDELVASWTTMMERQKHDPFLSIPPDGWPHRGWSKALPKFDGIPTREGRVRAYLTWCQQHVTNLQEEFPELLRTIDTADMNDPAKINALLDWIGMPATGRRLELLGTPVNSSQPE
jgi:hypothetical protein